MKDFDEFEAMALSTINDDYARIIESETRRISANKPDADPSKVKASAIACADRVWVLETLRRYHEWLSSQI